MLAAARVGDSIEHENWTDTYAQPRLMIGRAVVVVLTGGGFLAVIVAVGTMSLVGTIVDAVLAPSGEKIKTGATTVFTNLKAAALAHAKCTVDHGVVETGAEHVFIEESNASRVRDLTNCPGYIKEGSKRPNQVVIGGRRAKRDRPGWYVALLTVDMAVSAVTLASSLRAIAARGGLRNMPLGQGAWEGGQVLGDIYGTGSGALELGTGRTPMQVGKSILDSFFGD